MSCPHNEDATTTATARLDDSNISQVRARAIWQKVMGQATLPVKYAKTSALLLGWEPDDDDTGVKDELENLKQVLLEKYKFNVQLRLMNCATDPQIQAFQHLANFVAAHDQPRTLLIIYYAGHGFFSGKGDSHIALSGRTFLDEKDKTAYSIDWNEVERTLSTTPSDVLVIFDCCHAGLLCRSAREGRLNPTRSFQYLGACESGQLTKRGGPNSFTSAITWALGKLANETSFPVTKLVKTIEEYADFPPRQKPVLFGGRFAAVDENICIAHMRGEDPVDERTETTVQVKNTPPTKGVLELQLHFPEEVTEENVAESARLLKACMLKGTLHCHEVTFVDMYPRDSMGLMRRAASRWREYVREKSRRDTGIASNRMVAGKKTGTPPAKLVRNSCPIWHRRVVVSWVTLAIAFTSVQALLLFFVHNMYPCFFPSSQ